MAFTDSANTSPFYIVFAGVNGAGKSTLYKSGIWKNSISGLPARMERVNSDEVLRKLHGDPSSPHDQLVAGKAAVRRINELFNKRKTFNQETTLCGRLVEKNFKRARELGYRIVMYYVGVKSADVALSRIRHRVGVGGHDVDAQDVRRRFSSSMASFDRLVCYCEEAIVFDNTHEFKTIAQWSNGTLSWVGSLRTDGSWLLDALLGREQQREIHF